MTSRAIAAAPLNERQRLFAEILVRCGSPVDAARQAGYAFPEQDGRRLVQHPAVVRVVHAELMRVLRTESAPLALSVLHELVIDKKGTAGPRIRLDAAKALLERATSSEKLTKGSKDGALELSEMSPTQLREFIDSQEQQIATLKIDLADMAKDANDMPDSAPNASEMADYLD